MKRIPGVSILVLSAFLAAACDDNDDITGANNSCSSLNGTYTASTFTATGTANSSLNRNFLTDGGAFTVAFNNTSFSSSYTAATGVTPLIRTGVISRTNNNITLGTQALWTGGAAGSQVFACALSGNTLTLTAQNTTYDFAGTGSSQPARINLTLNRQM